ncbi:hypothetical protein VTO42DRAFT_8618 [Malbranchea cinnamomea]
MIHRSVEDSPSHPVCRVMTAPHLTAIRRSFYSAVDMAASSSFLFPVTGFMSCLGALPHLTRMTELMPTPPARRFAYIASMAYFARPCCADRHGELRDRNNTVHRKIRWVAICTHLSIDACAHLACLSTIEVTAALSQGYFLISITISSQDRTRVFV